MSEQKDKTQGPLNISTKRRNKNECKYFTFQSEMNFSFKQDCEKLLLAFKKLQSFSFKTFAGVWKNMSFSLIFDGQEFKDELESFMESSFFTIKKYLIFSESIYVQVGAFYMLYALYYKQPCSDKVKIRLTCEEFTSVSSLLQKMTESKIIEFEAIYTKLKCENAFWYVEKPLRYGLEGKFMWQEKKLTADIFESISNFDLAAEVTKGVYSEDFYGLNYLQEVDQEYTQSLKKFGITTQSRSIVEDLKLLCNQLKESSSEESEENCDKEETIDPKKTTLKDLALSTANALKRSCKTKKHSCKTKKTDK